MPKASEIESDPAENRKKKNLPLDKTNFLCYNSINIPIWYFLSSILMERGERFFIYDPAKTRELLQFLR